MFGLDPLHQQFESWALLKSATMIHSFLTTLVRVPDFQPRVHLSFSVSFLRCLKVGQMPQHNPKP